MERQAKVDRETARMRGGEVITNGWDFKVGSNPALQYSLELLCGFNPELKPDMSAAIENGWGFAFVRSKLARLCLLLAICRRY